MGVGQSTPSEPLRVLILGLGQHPSQQAITTILAKQFGSVTPLSPKQCLHGAVQARTSFGLAAIVLLDEFMNSHDRPQEAMAAALEDGTLLPDSVMHGCLQETLSRHKIESFVLDGYPCSIEQVPSVPSPCLTVQQRLVWNNLPHMYLWPHTSPQVHLLEALLSTLNQPIDCVVAVMSNDKVSRKLNIEN
jgi:hypothetical protein